MVGVVSEVMAAPSARREDLEAYLEKHGKKDRGRQQHPLTLWLAREGMQVVLLALSRAHSLTRTRSRALSVSLQISARC